MSHAPVAEPTNASTARTYPLPVLMTPLRRCGSHAIRLRLAQSPDFYSPYPLHIVDFMPLVPLYGDLNEDGAYFQLVLDMVGLVNANVDRWAGVGLDPRSIFDAVRQRTPRSAHAINWEMLFQAAKQHDARVVMDKGCEGVHFADDILAAAPRTRFLNVVRDPRAQVSSLNRAIILDFDTALNAVRWVQAHDAAAELERRHPDRVLTVRFEDLVLNPEPVLRRVCTFLDLEYLPTMVEAGASAKELAHRSALWENNDKPLDPSFIDKYTRYLSEREIEIIETLAAEHMRRYGYEFRTRASADIDDKTMSRAATRSAEVRREAWKQLRTTDPHDYQTRCFRQWYLQALRERLSNSGGAVPAPPGW